MLYSLLATCKLHGVNPFDYLRDVIDVLAVTPLATSWSWIQSLEAEAAEPRRCAKRAVARCLIASQLALSRLHPALVGRLAAGCGLPDAYKRTMLSCKRAKLTAHPTMLPGTA